ncbi:MAG: hypothetical protein U0V70_14235 [Terriglobia bacterium]
MQRYSFLLMLLALLLSMPLQAVGHEGCEMEILVNSNPVPEYSHNGKIYIEALKNREYAVRLRNPYNSRVAVALAVDGLNTIDARHTSAANAKKWILGPYESITIEGWQVNLQDAKKFYFTSEEKSYGKWLGQTQNLGVISAVFYREKSSPPACPILSREMKNQGSARDDREEGPSLKSSNEPADRSSKSSSGAIGKIPSSEESAATGMGTNTNHPIQWVSMELDPTPVAVINLRYEYRNTLVSMGVLPPPFCRFPLERRERAQGFNDQGFCPEIR